MFRWGVVVIYELQELGGLVITARDLGLAKFSVCGTVLIIVLFSDV